MCIRDSRRAVQAAEREGQRVQGPMHAGGLRAPARAAVRRLEDRAVVAGGVALSLIHISEPTRPY